MSNDTHGDRRDFMTWLEETVRADPEGIRAAKEEHVHLYLARALREAREAAGMTQALVAEASGLRQSMVSRLESPNHNPTMASVVRFLDAVQAELVLSVVVGDRQFSASEAAERTVTVPNEVRARAETRGLTIREYVLQCTADYEARENLSQVVHREMRAYLGVLQSWMQAHHREEPEPEFKARHELELDVPVAA